MPINVDTLRSAAQKGRPVTARNINEAVSRGIKTAFLCHSHKDAELAKGLERLLNDAGWTLYIDWDDASMPEVTNRETAQKIQQNILNAEYFLFLATANSMASKWCPWEIGYADGKKPIDRILMVPTINGLTTHGNEYLQLYKKVDYASTGELATWRLGDKTGTLLKNL
ncbi:toll/interleukin-1 receptor domain-containing protein [Polaromonas sp.]|uniref:toll/interleukin-1 receptor domain-containing protein n=1 Tax=Polaromonas sp. TaxID=1869339 RepID=UPI00272F49B0|nr:toll/interleukin-1 receptor domain-containing protein [Polaromonas sp.]MDP1743109.1 toll/interleukin-1 receptor domain-containing protein [Polaromonas sp.]